MLEDDLLKAENYRDRVSTVTEQGKRKWVFATKPEGKYYSLREIVAWVYLAIFVIVPFIRINDMPFILFNVVEAKIILFSKVFWPQDFFIFAVAMITFIIFIVLFTIVFGRVFCGWVCPQTVFMEFVFRRIEWLIEGNANQQIKLHEQKWNSEKVRKRILKYIVFFILSFVIANFFLMYIIGYEALFKIIQEPISEHLILLGGLLFFTFLFFSVFAFVREIVCTTVCPYGRLQGVMYDKDTLQISYDYNRGEPRGKLRKEDTETHGDCIDCKKCVHVCPTGIDIRDGLQLECVGCTACIDVCDDVMQKINKPKGLIRYASLNELASGLKFNFNARMKAYTALLVVLFVFMGYLIFSMKHIDTYISRARGQLFQELPDNRLSNLYEAKIINKTNKPQVVELKVEELDGTVKLIGKNTITLKEESVNPVTFFVELPKKEIAKRSTNIKIGIYQNGQKIQTVKTKFLGPFL